MDMLILTHYGLLVPFEESNIMLILFTFNSVNLCRGFSNSQNDFNRFLRDITEVGIQFYNR